MGDEQGQDQRRKADSGAVKVEKHHRDYRGVADTGHGTIELTFRLNGERQRARIPQEPTKKNLKAASTHLGAVETAIKDGTFTWKHYFPESKQAREEVAPVIKGGLTLGVAIDKGIGLCLKKVSRETLATYVREGRFWKRKLGEDTDIATITKNAVKEIMIKREIGNKRSVNLLIPLRKAFDYAQDEHKLPGDINPLDSLKITILDDDADAPYDEADARADPFLRSEVDLLATAPRSGAIWKLWGNTGMRGQELSALLQADVRDGKIHISRAMRLGRVKKTKTFSSTRVLDLSEFPPDATEALNELLRQNVGHPNVIVNPNTGKAFSGDRPLRMLFIRDCLKLGVKYKHPRFLRHSFASWALEASESPLWVAKNLGHKTVEEVMKVYARHIPKNSEAHGSKLRRAIAEGRELGEGLDGDAK
jgi:integrase